MADRQLEYKLILDTTNFQSSISSATAVADKGIGGIITGVRGLAAEIAIATAGISLIAGALVKMYNEFQEAAQNAQQLQTALRNAGLESEIVTEAFENQVDILTELTTVDDDTIVKLQALGVQFGLTANQTMQATKGAIGLSKALGIDLEMAMKLVANGMNGSYEMLGRYYPLLKNISDESQKAATFNKLLADSFNIATDQAKLNVNQGDQLIKQFNNILEAGGKVIAIIWDPMQRMLTDIAKSINYLINGLNELLGKTNEYNKTGEKNVAILDKQTTKTKELTDEEKKRKEELQKTIDEVKKYQSSIMTEVEKAQANYKQWLDTFNKLTRFGDISDAEMQELAKIDTALQAQVAKAIKAEKDKNQKILDDKETAKQKEIALELKFNNLLESFEKQKEEKESERIRKKYLSSDELAKQRLLNAQKEIQIEKDKENEIQKIKSEAKQKEAKESQERIRAREIELLGINDAEYQAIQERMKARKEENEAIAEAQNIFRSENQTTWEIIQSGYQSVTNGVSEFIRVGLDGGNALAAAANAFKSAFINAIAEIITKMLVLKAFQASFNFFSPGLGTILFGGGKAVGGPVSGGTTYLVGERGPELFTPQTSGAIIPNHALSMSDAKLESIEKAIRISDMNNIAAQKKYQSVVTVVDRLQAQNAELIASLAALGTQKINAVVA